MVHIHTLPGQIDYTVDVLIVHTESKTVLLRIHEKYKTWLAVGGHVELNETPEAAALREVKEEVGLDITLWNNYSQEDNFPKENYKQVTLPPYHMNIHSISEDHRHLASVYYAYTTTRETSETEDEKSGGLRWWTKEELVNANDIEPVVRWYAIEALDTLCK